VYSTTVDYYVQRQTVVLYSGTSNRRYDIVYAKNLTLTKGVTNKIQFEILNQDQRPVDITGKTISFRLIKNDNSITFIKKQVIPTLALKGLAELTLDGNDLLPVDAQMCYYSLVIDESFGTMPIYVSPDALARGTVNVVNAVFPEHLPSISILIPSHPAPDTIGINFNSSEISTLDQKLFSDRFSVQMRLVGYTGNITVQGSTIQSADWYNITNPTTYTNVSDSIWFSCEGYHPWVRVKFDDVTTGDVENILIR
jgi:hypothetical protein